MSTMTESQLLAIRDQHEAWLQQQPGITGAGIGIGRDGQLCIKIYTDHITPDTRNDIAARLHDVPIDFEETGEFRAF